MIIGIPIFNLAGGGMHHLLQILKSANPKKDGFSKIIIWGNSSSLDLIQNEDWIIKKKSLFLEYNILVKYLWQKFILKYECIKHDVKILFIPGQIYTGNFEPFVCISQNALPFEKSEYELYKYNLFYFKLLIIRNLQIKTFKNSKGIIFISNYGKKLVERFYNLKDKSHKIIPHGIDKRFYQEPKTQLKISKYSKGRELKIIYVSTIDYYKHQDKVVEVVATIINEGLHISLDLYGAYYKPAYLKLIKKLNKIEKNKLKISYLGEVKFTEMHKIYHSADLFLYASSCENLPLILLEAMASGLPILSSNSEPMFEVLGYSTPLFNPRDIFDMKQKLNLFLNDEILRRESVVKTHLLSKKYNWQVCSNETFAYLKLLI